MLLIASLGPGGHETEIDSLKYKNTASAQAVWKSQWGTSVLRVDPFERESVLHVEIPANQKSPNKRLTLDRELNRNLSSPGQFQVDIRLLSPPSGERLSLYFHSGEGWYTTGADVRSEGWTRLVFKKTDFQKEGHPAGWDQIDGIRLSLWKGKNQRPKMLLRNLSGYSNLIAIIVPDDQDNKQSQASYQVAETFELLLDSFHIEADRIIESSLPKGGLGKRKLAILPHNPTLSKEDCEGLNRYLNQGGKLFVLLSYPSRDRREFRDQTGDLLPTGEQ